MVRAMKLVAEMKKELSVEERNLLSVGYKNAIGSRRASWRTVVGIEAKALEKGDNQLKIEVAQEYREEIEQEMKSICNDVFYMLDNYLIPSSTTKENKAFFFKMLVSSQYKLDASLIGTILIGTILIGTILIGTILLLRLLFWAR